MDKEKLTVYVDGSCPVCSREVAWLRRRDREGQLDLVDINSESFDIALLQGVTHYELMRRIHARLPNGHLIQGANVFRAIYERLGFRHLVQVSRLPGVHVVVNQLYELFAVFRFRWVSRCAAQTASMSNSITPTSITPG